MRTSGRGFPPPALSEVAGRARSGGGLRPPPSPARALPPPRPPSRPPLPPEEGARAELPVRRGGGGGRAAPCPHVQVATFTRVLPPRGDGAPYVGAAELPAGGGRAGGPGRRGRRRGRGRDGGRGRGARRPRVGRRRGEGRRRPTRRRAGGGGRYRGARRLDAPPIPLYARRARRAVAAASLPIPRSPRSSPPPSSAAGGGATFPLAAVAIAARPRSARARRSGLPPSPAGRTVRSGRGALPRVGALRPASGGGRRGARRRGGRAGRGRDGAALPGRRPPGGGRAGGRPEGARRGPEGGGPGEPGGAEERRGEPR